MSFLFLYNALFLLAGCYGISLCVKVRQSGDLKDMERLLPQYATPDKCRDSKAFLDQTTPWLMFFGAATALNGLVGMLEEMDLLPARDVVHMGALLLFAVSAVAFFRAERAAIDAHWDVDFEEIRRKKRAAKWKKKQSK